MNLFRIARILGISITGATRFFDLRSAWEKTRHPLAKKQFEEFKEKFRQRTLPSYYYNDSPSKNNTEKGRKK